MTRNSKEKIKENHCSYKLVMDQNAYYIVLQISLSSKGIENKNNKILPLSYLKFYLSTEVKVKE